MHIGIREITSIDNTPGFWYAIAYFVSALIFIRSNHAIRKTVYKWICVGVIGIVLLVFMHVTTGCYGLYFFFVMTLVFAMIYSLFALCIEGDFYKRAYCTVRTFMCGELMASAGWQFFYFFVSQKIINNNFFFQALCMIIAYFVIAIIYAFLEKRHKPRNRETYITRKEFITVAIGMFILYSISNMSYVVTGTPFTTIYTSELFIIRTIIDSMAVAMLYLYHELLQQTAERVEAETVKNILELQYSQYQITKESMDIVNQKYHDLKHQIVTLKDSINNQDSSEYLDRMLSDIKKYETRYNTGNSVLDTILSAQALKCQARGIEFTCVADGQAISFMDPMDISALFGNAIDNAIEGTEKLTKNEEKLIHLTVDKQKSFVRIYVENRYGGSIKFYHQLPLSTKKDKNLHGFGVKSMKQIAEKYGGSLVTEAEDRWFKLSILIPV